MTITAWLKSLFTKTNEETEMTETTVGQTASTDTTAQTTDTTTTASIDAFAANLKAILTAVGKDVTAFDEAVALAKKV